MIHGDRRTYRKGCRCEDCTRANTRYTKQLRMDHNRGERRTIDGTGTRRRILALGCIGWSYSRISAELGTTKAAVSWLVRAETRVFRDTAASIADVYDRLSMTPGPGDARVARMARLNGGHPPLAWDDDTIDDPAATPHVDSTRRVGAPGLYVEDVEFLLRLGENRYGIAARLGVQPDTVYQALRRAGRDDLIVLFNRDAARTGNREAS